VNKSTNNNSHSIDNNIFAKAKQSFLWVFLSSIVFQIINWCMTILVMRILTPKDYGIFAILMIAVEYLGLLTHFNIGSWYVWKDKITKSEEMTVECSILIISFFIFIASFILAPIYTEFFNIEELTTGFRIISLLFLLGGFSKISLMKFEREMNFRPTAILNVSLRLFRGILTLILAIIGLGYWSLLYGLLATNILKAILLFYLKRPLLFQRPKNSIFEFSTFKESLLFGFNITVGTFFWIIYSSSDNLIIGKFFGAEMLGYYSIAFFFIDLPLSKLNEWVRPILLPYFSRLRENMDILNNVFLRFLFIYMTILVPIFFGLFIMADEFVYFVLGEKWQGAVLFLRVLAFVGLLRSLTDLIQPYLTGLGKPECDKYYNSVGVAIMPLSFYLAQKYFGINGILYAWFFVYPIIPMLMLWFFHKFSGISLKKYIIRIFPALLSGCFMVIIVLFLKYHLFDGEKSVVFFIGQVVIGAAVYSLSMLFLFKKQLIEASHVFRE
jgi:O-antigen/teichoic acid export membrane protein